MTNLEVVKYYVAGMEKGKTANLRIEGANGELLINYGTVLAQRLVDENGIVSYIVNETKYSRSTSSIQSLISQSIPENMIAETVTNVPMGASSLN
jgi:hypothetical protein